MTIYTMFTAVCIHGTINQYLLVHLLILNKIVILNNSVFKELPKNSVVFKFGGRELQDEDTVTSLGLKNSSIIKTYKKRKLNHHTYFLELFLRYL